MCEAYRPFKCGRVNIPLLGIDEYRSIQIAKLAQFPSAKSNICAIDCTSLQNTRLMICPRLHYSTVSNIDFI